VVALFAGPHWLPEPGVLPAPMLLWVAVWGHSRSFVDVGRVVYGHGGESTPLETGSLGS